jgi:hypothetical protein
MPALEFDQPTYFGGRLLNAEPSPEDPRDFTFDGLGGTLPARFVWNGMGPVLDQGATGTCGAHGAAGIRHWQEKRDGHGVIPIDVMRLYDLVKTAVDQDPDPGRVKGTHIRSVLRLLKGTGTPLKGARAPGAGGKIATYWRVPDHATFMKQALVTHGPLLVRCDWDAAWMTLPLNRILRAPAGRWVGGHIFVIFGWDDAVNGGSWLMRNSWGRWSALGSGNAYMNRVYFATHRPEAWATTDKAGDPVKT